MGAEWETQVGQQLAAERRGSKRNKEILLRAWGREHSHCPGTEGRYQDTGTLTCAFITPRVERGVGAHRHSDTWLTASCILLLILLCPLPFLPVKSFFWGNFFRVERRAGYCYSISGGHRVRITSVASIDVKSISAEFLFLSAHLHEREREKEREQHATLQLVKVTTSQKQCGYSFANYFPMKVASMSSIGR